MKLLLDTQCWLWWFAQPERLSEEAITYIADETNELWLSVASIWEIGIKVAIAKLPLPEPPFDRMLIAQAQLENITLVSADAIFRQYNDVAILWAANS